MIRNAIVAKRVSNGPVDVDEIQALTEAAGHEVVDGLTQVRAEDPGTNFGAGKVAELSARVADTDADLVVVDGELTPSQHHALVEAMPDRTTVQDRYRLVLEIFSEQASSRRAQLQVELAQLKYDLPRTANEADEGWFNKAVEKGSPLYDIRDRIDTLERKLDELPEPADEFRKRRREDGFDLVTIAGYTNAGKSTLLHRLADDLDLANASPDHSDRNATAAMEDRLFKTLETTTRRATLDGRPALVTDTVGFVSDLPHWLVASFSETLSEAAAADVVVLVADASDPTEELREKLRVSLDVLDAQDVPRESILLALNKVDVLAEHEKETRLAAAADIVPAPLPVSVVDGQNVDTLVERICGKLPTERVTFELPNCDETMRTISWAYDNGRVVDVTYRHDEVLLTFEARPMVVQQASARVERSPGPPE